MTPAPAVPTDPRLRVTVVIAAFNAAPFLNEAIESVVRQTYTGWRLVVADNASTDGTLEVARAWEEREPNRVAVVAVGRNAGAGGGRNSALAVGPATELVAILDADDRWCETYLERQLAAYDAALEAGGRPGVVACDAYLLTPSGLDDRTYRDLVGRVERVTYDAMIEKSHVFVSAVFPRRAYDEVGGFSEAPWGAEDYDLWLRILERGYEIVMNDEPLAFYRYHSGSMSSSLVTMSDAVLVAYDRALARGCLAPPQRRAIQRRMRHYRALRARAAFFEALRSRDAGRAFGSALRAVPLGVIAVAQDPSRWGEWLRDLVRRGSDDLRRQEARG